MGREDLKISGDLRLPDEIPEEEGLLPMKIHLRFFSSYRDIVGAAATSFEVVKGTSLGELLDSLISIYPRLKPFERTVLLAVNREFADLRTKLNEGDEVALMPPVGGG